MSEFDGLDKTTNLGLFKPTLENVADIRSMSENMDLIDAAITADRAAYVAADEAVKKDTAAKYLPLTGGTISGDLAINRGFGNGSATLYHNVSPTVDYGLTVECVHADGVKDNLTIGNYHEKGIEQALTYVNNLADGSSKVYAVYGEHNLKPVKKVNGVSPDSNGDISQGVGLVPADGATELPFYACGARYTAPTDGYFYAFMQKSNDANGYLALQNDTNGMHTECRQNVWAGGCARVFIPVAKGHVVSLWYDITASEKLIRFVSAKGAK